MTAVQSAQVAVAGVWLGCLLFTTWVVSPALKRVRWQEPERVLVRSAIGRQFTRVANPVLALLLALAVVDGILAGSRPAALVKIALVVLVILLSASHGFFFGRRLKILAGAERSLESEAAGTAIAKRRHRLQRLSVGVSTANLVLSLAVLVPTAAGR